MMKVLIVESEFLHQDTWVGNAVERLADALSQQNVTVIKSTSFDDGFAILSSNEAIDCLMFSYQMEHPDEHQNVRQLIGKLHERQQNVPVFLLGDREKALAAMDRDLLELVDEFAWILEDTADFTVYIPQTDAHFAPSLAVIPLQLLAYYVSVAKGLDVDKPRNLAKSVTVE